MTSGERHKLRLVLKDIRGGKYRDAIAELCRLADWEGETPEIAPRRRARRVERTPDYSPKALAPVETPPARHVDPQAITAFKRTHRHCATLGRDCQGALTFSHIRARAQGGDDCDANGLSQCVWHHDVWESSRIVWWRMLSHRLSPGDRDKVLAVFPELGEIAVNRSRIRSKVHARNAAAGGRGVAGVENGAA